MPRNILGIMVFFFFQILGPPFVASAQRGTQKGFETGYLSHYGTVVMLS
jgi:threonine/homoserine/homoserine lactone efflux protein